MQNNSINFEQASKILMKHAEYASHPVFNGQFQVVLFGESVYKPVIVRSVADMRNLLEQAKLIKEPYTNTHLAMKQCRIMFEEHLKNNRTNHSNCSFHATFITDGQPTSSIPDLKAKVDYTNLDVYNEDEKTRKNYINYIQRQTPENQQVLFSVVDEIAEMASKVKKDSELGITFIQVGNDRGVEHFFKFLDDALLKHIMYYMKMFHNKILSADQNMDVFDLVDSFKYTTTVDKKLTESQKEKNSVLAKYKVNGNIGNELFAMFPYDIAMHSIMS